MQVEEAETVYAADLGYDPSIPRSYWRPGNVCKFSAATTSAWFGWGSPSRRGRLPNVAALARADVPNQVIMLLPHGALGGRMRY